MKTVTLNGNKIDIYPFSAKQGLELRNEIIDHVKKTAVIKEDNLIEIGKVFVSLLYNLPPDLTMKLLEKSCIEGLGNLNQEEVFNQVFNEKIDSVILHILDIVEYNGFFSQNLFTELLNKAKKIPMLQKMMENLKGKNTVNSLKDLMKK